MTQQACTISKAAESQTFVESSAGTIVYLAAPAPAAQARRGPGCRPGSATSAASSLPSRTAATLHRTQAINQTLPAFLTVHRGQTWRGGGFNTITDNGLVGTRFVECQNKFSSVWQGGERTKDAGSDESRILWRQRPRAGREALLSQAAPQIHQQLPTRSMRHIRAAAAAAGAGSLNYACAVSDAAAARGCRRCIRQRQQQLDGGRNIVVQASREDVCQRAVHAMRAAQLYHLKGQSSLFQGCYWTHARLKACTCCRRQGDQGRTTLLVTLLASQ